MQTARLIIGGVAILMLSAGASSDDYVLTEPALKEALAEYELAVKTAREKFLPQFDKVIGMAKNKKTVAVEERAKIVSELEQQRVQFLVDGTVPLNPVLIKLAQPYGKATDQAALKLSGQFKKVAKALVDAGKLSEATALLKYRDELILGEGFELVGHWRLAEGIGAHGFSEQYVIQKRMGQWTVERSFYEPNAKKVGASSAIDLTYADGALTYTDHFTVKPRAEWHDKADMKIWADPDSPATLKLRWVVGSGQSDQNTLVPVN